MAEEISTPINIQAPTVWLFLVALNQVYSETQKQKAEQKDFKNLQFSQKRSTFKIGAKEDVVTKEIRAIKEESYT
jgi:hypothetical protein